MSSLTTKNNTAEGVPLLRGTYVWHLAKERSGVATDAGASRRRNCASVLDMSKNFPSSPKRPVHPCGSLSFLCNGLNGLFAGDQMNGK